MCMSSYLHVKYVYIKLPKGQACVYQVIYRSSMCILSYLRVKLVYIKLYTGQACVY